MDNKERNAAIRELIAKQNENVLGRTNAEEKYIPEFNWKKNENKLCQEFETYVYSTYDQHYNTDDGIQAIDVWEALGSLETTSRDNCIKYLMRYGKKGGKNRSDLLKAMHFILLMIYCLDKETNDKQN